MVDTQPQSAATIKLASRRCLTAPSWSTSSKGAGSLNTSPNTSPGVVCHERTGRRGNESAAAITRPVRLQ